MIQCFGTPKVWHFCSLLTFTATSRCKSNKTHELTVRKDSLNHWGLHNDAFKWLFGWFLGFEAEGADWGLQAGRRYPHTLNLSGWPGSPVSWISLKLWDWKWERRKQAGSSFHNVSCRFCCFISSCLRDVNEIQEETVLRIVLPLCIVISAFRRHCWRFLGMWLCSNTCEHHSLANVLIGSWEQRANQIALVSQGLSLLMRCSPLLGSVGSWPVCCHRDIIVAHSPFLWWSSERLMKADVTAGLGWVQPENCGKQEERWERKVDLFEGVPECRPSSAAGLCVTEGVSRP